MLTSDWTAHLPEHDILAEMIHLKVLALGQNDISVSELFDILFSDV